ncbi:type II and III secretion system protein family protein [Oceanicola sp. S124]|uniref:type II and III secretion system protein family protein n=1 Tax=Oceanicola sp. S124 TaxID=1042378 RepID=UPI0002559723|nr:type II and III secretion system protein family protein [Oceanicola sp. S124]
MLPRLTFPRLRPPLLALATAAGLADPASLAAQTVLETTGRPITMFAGEGKLVQLDTPASSVFLADPETADVEVKSPTLLYLYGKSMGETTLFVIDDTDQVALSSLLRVTLNAEALSRAAHAAVRRGSFSVTEVDGAILLSGMVETIGDAQQIETVVRALAGPGAPIVNSLHLSTPPQVNLQVRIAEVSRTVTNDLSSVWGEGITGGAGVAGGFAVASDFQIGDALLGLSLEALQTQGLVTILSEPNLTARSGDTASFLAGGRFPYQTSGGSSDRVSVTFEPFGVELEFTPEVMRTNQIKLNVNTKIRELDFSNGSQTGAQNLPLILERSAETTIEVGSGQSFAIAGLFSASTQQDIDKIPGLGDLPLLGALFRSTSFQQGKTELVIIVTPYIVAPGDPASFKTPVDRYAPATATEQMLLGKFEGSRGGDGSAAVSVRSINGKAGLLLQ